VYPLYLEDLTYLINGLTVHPLPSVYGRRKAFIREAFILKIFAISTLLIFIGLVPRVVLADGTYAVADQLSLSGWLHVLVGDPPRGMGGEPSVVYTLTDDEGRNTRLFLNADLVRHFGGPQAVDRKRVKIVAVPLNHPAGAVTVLSIDLKNKDKGINHD